jgi:hypothetical protein
LQNNKELLLLLKKDNKKAINNFPQWYKEKMRVLGCVEEDEWMQESLRSTIKNKVKKF